MPNNIRGKKRLLAQEVAGGAPEVAAAGEAAGAGVWARVRNAEKSGAGTSARTVKEHMTERGKTVKETR
jgi:hypothetical protein